MTMGESRQELLAWINDLLQVNYTKIEQVGSGDVQLSKVKFNTNQEYEYVNNFKVLQKAFTDHKIEKVIPVERLVKCRFQDNLEFMQWVKKYWDTYFPGGNYDAVGRRRGTSASKSTNLQKTGSNSSVERGSVRKASPATPQTQRTGPVSVASKPAPRAGALVGGVNPAEFQKQITQLQVTIDGIEKERDFYFAKLRDVEILVQNCLDSASLDEKVERFCKDLQEVLYSTEDGFEVPEGGEAQETF